MANASTGRAHVLQGPIGSKACDLAVEFPAGVQRLQVYRLTGTGTFFFGCVFGPTGTGQRQGCAKRYLPVCDLALPHNDKSKQAHPQQAGRRLLHDLFPLRTYPLLPTPFSPMRNPADAPL